MQTRTVNLNVNSNDRLLFISDIHGNNQGFLHILKKAKFKKNDYLFIIGDIIEKGDECIALLDSIFQLIDSGYKVYPIMGNCEELLTYMMPPVNNELLLNYVLTKKSILNEFAKRLNIKITRDSNLNTVCWYCYRNFKKYYDFLLSLPHIIYINNKLTLVHGGIHDELNIPSNAMDVMKVDNFYFNSNKKKNIVIVGHYPTINYHDDFPNLNPIIDLNKNIISIDGGNNVVPWGQLNLLIIDNIENLNISYITHDEYKFTKIVGDVCGNNLKLFNMPCKDNEVKILDELHDYYICKHVKTGTVVPVLKVFVSLSKDTNTYYTYDAFNYMPTLSNGEEVKLVYYAYPYSIVKKDGVVGLVDSKFIKKSR